MGGVAGCSFVLGNQHSLQRGIVPAVQDRMINDFVPRGLARLLQREDEIWGSPVPNRRVRDKPRTTALIITRRRLTTKPAGKRICHPERRLRFRAAEAQQVEGPQARISRQWQEKGFARC